MDNSIFSIIFAKKNSMENPFYITGIIPEAYFCDREAETDKIITLLENQSNVLLTAYRRMGKTQLIRHIFEQPRVKENYYTFYVDLYSTSSLREMAYFMGKEIYRTLVPGKKRSWNLFFSTVKSLAAGFSIDPVTGAPAARLQLGDIHSPALTLEEIFTYLEKADKPCIFAIDEFQQIARYKEDMVEELLRTHIQQMNNCHFLFSGSDRHILEQMFHSYAKPFYNSAKPVFLDRIPKESYIQFTVGQFAKAGRTMPEEAVAYCYDLFEGYTFYMHNIFHDIFAFDRSEFPGRETVLITLNDILEENSHTYKELMGKLSLAQKQTLAAIARERTVDQPTSGAFVRQHALGSPSSVQKAIASLLDQQLITYRMAGDKKVYFVADKYLDYWLRETY